MVKEFNKTKKLIKATKNEVELTKLYKTIAYQVIMKEAFSKEEVRELQTIVAKKYEIFGIKL